MDSKSFFLPSADGQVQLHLIAMEHAEPLPVLVMLHGGPGSGAEPLLELPAFQALDRRFTTVYFDQRGSGESRYPLCKGITQEQVTSDVATVVDWARKTYPDRKIFLWGGSFGGLLGLLTLDRYPKLVDRAVLTSPAIYPGDTMLQFFLEAKRQGGDKLPEDVRSQFNSIEDKDTLMKALDSDAVCDWLASFPEAVKGQEGLFHSHAMRSWFLNGCDARPVVGRVKIPLLLIQGMEDPFCPAQVLLDAVRDYPNPNVSCKTFSPCGHSTFEDCEKEFVEEITNFLMK